MRKQAEYIPVSVRQTKNPKTNENKFILSTARGRVLTTLLPENVARAYAKAINTFYMPREGAQRLYKSDVELVIDIPFQTVPKGLAAITAVKDDGTYVSQPDRAYSKFLSDAGNNINQYIVFQKDQRELHQPIWIECVFHIEGKQQPTLAELCSTVTDMLAHVKITQRRFIASLNNSRIVRDKTSRTEIVIRKIRGSTDGEPKQ